MQKARLPSFTHVYAVYCTVRGQTLHCIPSQAVVGGHLYAIPSKTARVGFKLKAPIWRAGTVGAGRA
jgi:hypothetical protein